MADFMAEDADAVYRFPCSAALTADIVSADFFAVETQVDSICIEC